MVINEELMSCKRDQRYKAGGKIGCDVRCQMQMGVSDVLRKAPRRRSVCFNGEA
jgi:hypothetical protein